MTGEIVKIVFMANPPVSEDGIKISLDTIKFKIYDHKVIDWESKKYPLNIYGDK